MRVLALALCLAAATTCASARGNSPPKVAARIVGKVAKFGFRLFFRTAKTAASVAEHAAVGGMKLATDGKTVPMIATLADPHSRVGAAARTAIAIQTALDVNRFVRRTRADETTLTANAPAPLSGASPAIGGEAVQKAGPLRNDVQCDMILKMLDDPSLDVREAAVKSLGEMRAQAAVDPLIGLLKSPEVRLRTAAAKALGQIGDPRATDALKAALGDESTRAVAQGALDSITRNTLTPPQPSPDTGGNGG